jgi:hypothetical protein
MPSIYLIVRFESANNTSPSFRTYDLTTKKLPSNLQGSKLHTIKDYTVINDAATGPAIYHAAVEIIKMDDKDVHISWGTMSRDEATARLQKIPKYAKESGVERHKVNKNTSTHVRWKDPMTVEIELTARKPDSPCLWYQLVEVEVGDEEEEEKVKVEIDKGREGKKRKTSKKAEADANVKDEGGGEGEDGAEEQSEEDGDTIVVKVPETKMTTMTTRSTTTKTKK